MPRAFTTPQGKNLVQVRKLGQGQFGVADLVRDRRSEQFCLKQVPVRTCDEEAKAHVLKEVNLMKVSVHPNVVVLYDSWFDRSRLYILMEYCANASVDLLIAEYAATKRHFTEEKVVSFLTELSSALCFLHDGLRIMHRDLKPANVFMDRIGTLKIGDFGLSKCLGGDEHLCATFVGTPLYMSPEQCRGDTYSFRTDVWALGCIAYEFMALRSPWTDARTTTYPALIRTIIGTNPRFTELELRYSSNLINSARWMLQKQPHRRWSAAAVNTCLRPRAIAPPIDAEPPPAAGAAGAAAAAAAAAALLGPSSDSAGDVALEETLVCAAARSGIAALAAERIQASYRLSSARRRHHAPEGGPSPKPRPLCPMDKEGPPATPPSSSLTPTPPTRPTPRPPPPPPPAEDDAAGAIQSVFRASLNRRRKPLVPRYARAPSLVPPHCSARINELAAPRAPKAPPSPGAKRVNLPRLPAHAPLPPRAPPRPAWT